MARTARAVDHAHAEVGAVEPVAQAVRVAGDLDPAQALGATLAGPGRALDEERQRGLVQRFLDAGQLPSRPSRRIVETRVPSRRDDGLHVVDPHGPADQGVAGVDAGEHAAAERMRGRLRLESLIAINSR